MAAKAIPDGFHTVTPYIMVKDAIQYLDFLKNAFSAKEIHLHLRPDGQVAHASLQIGNSMIMVSEGCTEGEYAKEWVTSPTTLYLYVTDADALYTQALSAGAESILEMADQLYGDRSGAVKDAWGNKWCIATHIEDVSNEEMEKRFAARASAETV